MLISRKDLVLILKIGFAGIIIFALHYLLYILFPRQLYAPYLFLLHPFMLSITVISAISVKIIFKKSKQSLFGYVYMAGSLVKMFLSIGFLFPVLRGEGMFKKEYVLQFFIIYFIYLVVEVYYLIRDFKSEK
ncbi:MAG: hypothetical protein C0596_01870 [Marinilabiliales bacterium]|nr:MAG: hypothetical protein C0596_01870 [Marinilabiliales bacterium]